MNQDFVYYVEFSMMMTELEKKRIKDGTDTNLWVQEMQRHPFFMRRTPDEERLEAAMKSFNRHMEENMKPMERALHHKEIGNFYLQHKAFTLATYHFSCGIELKGIDDEMRAILHNNRSAAHYLLKNYEPSLLDATMALNIKPDYTKARRRAVLLTKQLNLFDDCIMHCTKILQNEPENDEIRGILKEIKKKKLNNHRKDLKEFDRLVAVLKQRSIKIFELKKNGSITMDILKPKFNILKNHSVQLHTDNVTLLWTVVLSFFCQKAAVIFTETNENYRISNLLHLAFCAQPRVNRGVTEVYSIYYGNPKNRTWHKVNQSKKLKAMIDEKNFWIEGGTIQLFVMPSNKKLEEDFVSGNLYVKGDKWEFSIFQLVGDNEIVEKFQQNHLPFNFPF